MKQLLIILTLSIAGLTLVAQTGNGEQEWDLTYESLLDLNGVKWDHSQGTLFTWLKNREKEHNIISDFVQGELDKRPEATFLIDHPTFPSGGRTTILGVKNRAGCYFYWRSTDESMKEFKRKPISTGLFDQIFNRLHSLKQRGYENMGSPEKAYAGFLSTLKAGQAKQVLLHINDFLEFDVNNHQILRVGRIFEIEQSLQVKNN